MYELWTDEDWQIEQLTIEGALIFDDGYSPTHALLKAKKKVAEMKSMVESCI